MTQIWYTDGGCHGNPGPGGWAAVRIENNNIYKILHGNEDDTTNNRMELTAILEIFKQMNDDNGEDKYIIYSDSAYAVNAITKWSRGWASNGWLNSKKKPVENLDLIQELYYNYNKNFWRCQVVKISGHAGCIGNELADAVATDNISKRNKLIADNDLKIDN